MERKIYGWNVVTEMSKNGCYELVKYAYDTEKTYYPYKICKTGGLDNCSMEYTVDEFRRKIKNGTGFFK